LTKCNGIGVYHIIRQDIVQRLWLRVKDMSPFNYAVSPPFFGGVILGNFGLSVGILLHPWFRQLRCGVFRVLDCAANVA
jgi:hypothetical protein